MTVRPSARVLCKAAILSVLLILAGACASSHGPEATLYQAGVIDSLLAGNYDGFMTFSNLLTHGDTGIGTFDGLDGEMIVLDGEIYQVCADGVVHKRQTSVSENPDATTPFASVVHFEADQSFSINQPLDFEAFKDLTDEQSPRVNQPAVIKAHGHFGFVHTRSVPKQSKPYLPLAEVTKNQPEFYRANVSGTLVGSRLPAYMAKLNVPGYHLHFLSDDRQFGGHVLDFNILNGEAQTDLQDIVFLALPVDQPGFQSMGFEKDRSKELESAEQKK